MCLLNKFLFCCELETGGFIVGWFKFISSLIISTHYVLAFMFAPAVGDGAVVFATVFVLLNVTTMVVSAMMIRGIVTVSWCIISISKYENFLSLSGKIKVHENRSRLLHHLLGHVNRFRCFNERLSVNHRRCY